MSKIVLVLPDLQTRAPRNNYPEGEDSKTIKAVLKYAVDLKADETVFLGDIIDLPYFSKYEQVPVGKAVEWYEQDVQRAKRIIDPFRDISKRVHVIQGNHDYRGERFVAANPHLAKIVNIERDLGLKAGRAHYYRYWEDKGNLVRIGKATFGHGHYTNRYHAAKHAAVYPGTNFFYGHVHDIQSFDPVVYGHGSNNTAQSLGFLGRYDQPWLNNDPTNWQQAFAVFHFGAKGYFQHYVVRIFDHKFISPEGRAYK